MSELGLLTQERTEAISAANQQLDRRLARAVEGVDVESAMACFLDSPDLIVAIDGAVLRGFAELRQCLTQMWSGMKTLRLKIEPVARYQVGETVFALENAAYECERRGGKSAWKERWIDARQNVAGRWVYVLFQASKTG